jgi:very-short-patch-repair endonuclease
MTQSLEEKILSLLNEHPGLTAQAICSKLGVEKGSVTRLLYGRLNSKVKQDSQYRWYSAEKNLSDNDAAKSEQSFADTDAAKLCRYYLACMGQDEVGISTFASSKTGDIDYIELNSLPKNSEELSLNSNFQKILGKVRSDRSRQSMYLGYPTCLKFIKSQKSGWEGYMVEPVFLFPIEIENKGGRPHLDLSYPIINHVALRNYTNAEREALMSELVQLEDELGINNEEQRPSLDDLALRLKLIRAEWPWQEEIDPNALSMQNKSLSEIRQDGVYNRAVVVTSLASPFTQGLESELRELAKKQMSEINKTALGYWLTGNTQEKNSEIVDNLIEVLPMNSEQRQAVSTALTRKLTIITGPPGTGKSQVVTNLLINAAWLGKRVLFASKNNKAVDVVESRVNGMGNRPVLIRVGGNQYSTKLAEYLMGMLSASADEDDKISFQQTSEKHERLLNQINTQEAEIRKLLDARNVTDQLEQSIEEFRKRYSAEIFQKMKEIDLVIEKEKLIKFESAIDLGDKNKQSFIAQLFWPIIGKSRVAESNELVKWFLDLSKSLGLVLKEESVSENNLSNWRENVAKLKSQLEVSKRIKDYFQALIQLQQSKTLEEISYDRIATISEIADNSEDLWRLWIKLEPNKLSHNDRTLLNRYMAVLKMVIESGTDGNLEKSVAREYRSLFEKVSHLLSCWAATSLSVKKRVPFEAGFFDIVVFDEASQCDIASALPLLYRAKSAVVIGDPKQLSHISGLKPGQDQQLLDKFGLVGQYPHWAYSYNSLFDLAAGLVNKDNYINLLDHHRSHADIIEFSNQQFYEGRLRVATRYTALKPVTKNDYGVKWVDVKGRVKRPSSGGAINEIEVSAVIKILEEILIDQKYSGHVGVVSPFRAQANAISVAAKSNAKLTEALTRVEFLSDTVHKFQGDERDIIIFSPVVSSGISNGGLGFLRSNGNLFNVAITRARAQLVVVGDLSFCSNCDIDYLANFAKYTQDLKESEGKISSYNPPSDNGSKYPVVTNPESVSDWERLLYSALYESGIKTIPQYQVEKYALDFAIVLGDRRLNIEVDGERYHRNWTGELCRRDQIRNQRLYELGWDVMRFWVYEIRDDLPGCISKVKAWISKFKEDS